MTYLELSEEYRHYNTLIWQVPSWGIAIAAGVIVAADRVGENSNAWPIPTNYVQACILFFGFFLLTALTVALYGYRAYQAAAAPDTIPIPPFRRFPPGNLCLQAAVCLTCGGLGGLAVGALYSMAWPLPFGFALGLVGSILAEIQNKIVVEEIKRKRGQS